MRMPTPKDRAVAAGRRPRREGLLRQAARAWQRSRVLAGAERIAGADAEVPGVLRCLYRGGDGLGAVGAGGIGTAADSDRAVHALAGLPRGAPAAPQKTRFEQSDAIVASGL